LSEIRRVLKPGGKVIFAEHGEAPDINIANWQARVNPVWNVIAGGCHLNRRIESLYEGSGFSFDQIEKGYLKGPRIATYNLRGIASIA
jgi:SAM-dependent methyltransferase